MMLLYIRLFVSDLLFLFWSQSKQFINIMNQEHENAVIQRDPDIGENWLIDNFVTRKLIRYNVAMLSKVGVFAGITVRWRHFGNKNAWGRATDNQSGLLGQPNFESQSARGLLHDGVDVVRLSAYMTVGYNGVCFWIQLLDVMWADCPGHTDVRGSEPHDLLAGGSE